MSSSYLLAAPEGDIPLGENDLRHAFMVAPAEPHPFLTLGDYFQAIEQFYRQTIAAGVDAAVQLTIRSEKHGALYHIASVVSNRPETSKLAITTAVSAQARAMLTHEYGVFRTLAATGVDCLPGVLHMDTMAWQTETGSAPMSMVVGEWLDGYYEWHYSQDQDNEARIRLWDYQQGHSWLTTEEERQLFNQAARILTLYYDPVTFCQIYPWHHAAGDFILQRRPHDLDVKLITARDYRPFVPIEPEGAEAVMMGVLWFFLHLALRMRLDRCDGTGTTVWAPARTMAAVAAGFFAGLAAKSPEHRKVVGSLDELLGLMQSFDRQELLQLYQPLLELYVDEDLAVITANLDSHIETLQQALQQTQI